VSVPILLDYESPQKHTSGRRLTIAACAALLMTISVAVLNMIFPLL
jgi:hypothetical protein